VADDLAGGIELEHGRRLHAAGGGRRVLAGGGFVRAEQVVAVDDPHVILRIDRETDDLTQHPMVGKGLRPERVDLEPRRHHISLRGDLALEPPFDQAEPGQRRREAQTDEHVASRDHRSDVASRDHRPPPLRMNFCTRLPSRVSPV
jgi:hypothetical protein